MAIFERIGEKITNTSQDVVKKAKEVAEISRLNTQIGMEENIVKEKFFELGQQYYQDNQKGIEGDYTSLILKIRESKAKIEQYKQDILKEKKVRCCGKCGAEMPMEAAFCSMCGNKTEVERPQIEDVPKKQMLFCPNCGKQIVMGACFCPECGEKIDISGLL